MTAAKNVSLSTVLEATDQRAPFWLRTVFCETGPILVPRKFHRASCLTAATNVSLSIVLEATDQRAPLCYGQSFVRQVPSCCQEGLIEIDVIDQSMPFCYGHGFVGQVPSCCQEAFIEHRV